jgi:hypothetical protein
MKSIAGASILIMFANLNAQALVRIVPRSDYNQIGSVQPLKRPLEVLNLANPIADRINGLRDISDGQHEGGNYDVVYQQDESKSYIYICPTIRFCDNENAEVAASSQLQNSVFIQTELSRDKRTLKYWSQPTVQNNLNTCVQDPKFWNCKELLETTTERMCRNFKSTFRYVVFKNWFISNIIGSLVEDPFPIFEEGFIGTLNDASTYADAATSAYQGVYANCKSSSLDLAHKGALKPGIFVVEEEQKEDLSFMISAFSKNLLGMRDISNFSNEQKLAAGGFYREVQLDYKNLSPLGVAPQISVGPIYHQGEKTQRISAQSP